MHKALRRGHGHHCHRYEIPAQNLDKTRSALLAEIRLQQADQDLPARVCRLPCNSFCPIYVRPLSFDFVRPVSAMDVMSLLRQLPAFVVSGLKRVHLMGGIKRQDRKQFELSYYEEGAIYLFPFPKRKMVEQLKKRPKPHQMRAHELARTRFVQTRRGLFCHRDEIGLKRYYLYDVLLRAVAIHAQTRVQLDAARFVQKYGYSKSAPWRRDALARFMRPGVRPSAT